MRKIMTVILLLLFSMSPLWAAPGESREIVLIIPSYRFTIAVVTTVAQDLDTPETRELLQRKINAEFPRIRYKMADGDTVTQKFSAYAAKHKIGPATPATKDQLIDFAKQNEYDYLVHINLASRVPKTAADSPVSAGKNITLHGYVLDMNTEKLLLAKEYLTQRGKSPVSVLTQPALEKALTRFFNDVDIPERQTIHTD